MDNGWMNHDEDYEPQKRRPRKRSKPRRIPRAAKPDDIDARLAAIQRQAVATFQAGQQ